MPASSKVATTSQPWRSATWRSSRRWLRVVCSIELTRRYRATRLCLASTEALMGLSFLAWLFGGIVEHHGANRRELVRKGNAVERRMSLLAGGAIRGPDQHIAVRCP